MRLTRIIMTIVLGIVFAVTGCTKKPNKPDPTTGSLAITSEPSGLNIYLNGAKAGSTTPDTLELTAGTYELQLSASGYVTYRDSVTIEVSKTLPYHAALVLSIPGSF
ncbi:MAG: WD40-domain containing protein [Parcubacteria group bacterium GW2011_GWC2_49_9]|nr:MAG: WD40-domain containing protein [Parcubacteria group bacterium GW2011_GWC2_49_9]